MRNRTRGILAGVVLCAAGAAAVRADEGRKKDVPLYTDDDLQRVSPLRDQTGGGMVPAAPATTGSGELKPERSDEAYWRREAERLRARVDPWRERAASLRAEIEERRRGPGVRATNDPRLESLQRRLDALEGRIRETEDRLHERARRAGVPPGWLR